ncbi:MAG TPA: cyclic nucleotide-binding domain-containing protein [Planctomycetota bacterium]|nr:cyclic nucleotide-binding domain-containing protein [Planctomycetota bacterium]
MNLAELFRHESNLIAVAAGQTLFSAGETGDAMYVLVEGEASVIVGGTVVEESAPGAVLGEMALIDREPRIASVVAKTACKFAKIELKRFHFLISQTPNFATHVMGIMANRLRRMDRMLAGRQ